MRNLFLGTAALLVLAAANASPASAFETEYGDGSNSNAAARFTDPDEQFDEMAEHAGNQQVFVYNFGGSNSASGSQQSAAPIADHSVRWTRERIRLVFGPDAQ